MEKQKMTQEDYLKQISDFIFTSKYARYLEDKQRRETWDETVDRLYKMHLKHYKDILSKEDIQEVKWAFDMVHQKKVVPSMRSLQFGGAAIERHHQRMYNCAVRHIDSLRSFAECFHMLLCGCGVGFGLTNHFLDRLPDLVSAQDKTGSVITYTVEDTIEGWSDSVQALLNCYFKNTPYTGRKIVFDYSKIRKKGAPIKTGGGKAPGYKGLKESHIKIKKLLDYIIEQNHQVRLKTIDAYDILMHVADAVLSGGIRRCLPEYYSVQLVDGSWKKITDLQIGDLVLFEGKGYPVTNIYNNGVQKLLKINTKDGYHVSTPNHKWLVYNKETDMIEWVEAQNLSKNYAFLSPKKSKYLQEVLDVIPPESTKNDK